MVDLSFPDGPHDLGLPFQELRRVLSTHDAMVEEREKRLNMLTLQKVSSAAQLASITGVVKVDQAKPEA